MWLMSNDDIRAIWDEPWHVAVPCFGLYLIGCAIAVILIAVDHTKQLIDRAKKVIANDY